MDAAGALTALGSDEISSRLGETSSETLACVGREGGACRASSMRRAADLALGLRLLDKLGVAGARLELVGVASEGRGGLGHC